MDTILIQWVQHHVPVGPWQYLAICLLISIYLLGSGALLWIGGRIARILLTRLGLNSQLRKTLGQLGRAIGILAVLILLGRIIPYFLAFVSGIIIIGVGIEGFFKLWGALNIRKEVAQALILGLSIIIAASILSYVLMNHPNSLLKTNIVLPDAENMTAFDWAANEAARVPDLTSKGTKGGIQVEYTNDEFPITANR